VAITFLIAREGGRQALGPFEQGGRVGGAAEGEQGFARIDEGGGEPRGGGAEADEPVGRGRVCGAEFAFGDGQRPLAGSERVAKGAPCGQGAAQVGEEGGGVLVPGAVRLLANEQGAAEVPEGAVGLAEFGEHDAQLVERIGDGRVFGPEHALAQVEGALEVRARLGVQALFGQHEPEVEERDGREWVVEGLRFAAQALAGELVPEAGPEVTYLKRLSRDEFKAAFAEALEAPSDRELTVLRQYVLDGLGSDRLAALSRGHRATAAAGDDR
jgi:hypothetical protein